MAYKRGGGGESLYPRGLKSASKQAIVVLFKKRFALTGFTQGRTINRQFLQGKINKRQKQIQLDGMFVPLWLNSIHPLTQFS